METIKTEIKLYSYDELKGKSQDKAFNEHLNFLLENPSTYEDEDEQGNIITKYENILKWTDEEIKSYVEDSIKINGYLFFEDGTMANITHFTGKHKKSGTTEFYFQGKTYII